LQTVLCTFISRNDLFYNVVNQMVFFASTRDSWVPMVMVTYGHKQNASQNCIYKRNV